MTREETVEFFSNPEVINDLNDLNNADKIVEYLKGKGINISLEKANTLKEVFLNIQEYNGKLSDEQLDEIIGGASVGKIAAGIIFGVAAVGTIGVSGKFAYDVYNEVNKRSNPVGSIFASMGDVGSEMLSNRSAYNRSVVNVAKLLGE